MTKIYEWYEKIDFSEHKGLTLEVVFQKDPHFVETCMEQREGFRITINTLKHLEGLQPDFQFSKKAKNAIINQKKYSCEPGEAEFRLYPSGDPFIQPLDDIGFWSIR